MHASPSIMSSQYNAVSVSFSCCFACTHILCTHPPPPRPVVKPAVGVLMLVLRFCEFSNFLCCVQVSGCASSPLLKLSGNAWRYGNAENNRSGKSSAWRVGRLPANGFPTAFFRTTSY
eukprot:INCI7065.1.p1 GENE.INCI7065.1~~INCI7065.1.p1  ORF type:complete len:118 (+),score=5.49 INCI7065.1:1687-2040(+)